MNKKRSFLSIGRCQSAAVMFDYFQKYQVFSKILCIHENRKFRDYFRTCFAKFPQKQNYQIYSGLYSIMEKNPFAKHKNPENPVFRIAIVSTIICDLKT